MEHSVSSERLFGNDLRIKGPHLINWARTEGDFGAAHSPCRQRKRSIEVIAGRSPGVGALNVAHAVPDALQLRLVQQAALLGGPSRLSGLRRPGAGLARLCRGL